MNVPHSYRFATAAQWQACLLHRFDADRNGGIVLTPRLGLHAVQVDRAGPVSAVAVESYGAPFWRLDAMAAGDASGLRRLDELGRIIGPFEIDGTLAASPRWIADRHWLWGFDPRPTRLRRYDRETLQLDLTVTLDELCDAIDDDNYALPVSILDIAGDGEDGIWLLVQSANDLYWLIHCDCEGRPGERRRTPCEAGRVVQIGCTGRGQTVLLLQQGGLWLWLMNAADGSAVRAVRLGALAPCWTASRLSSDGRNRIAVGGRPTTPAGQPWLLFLLDAGGDLVDGPFQELFGSGPPPAAGDVAPCPADFAVSASALWFARSDGLWRLDASEECGNRESEATLLTPALVSPPTAENRGWLRAELTIDLPRGAIVQAAYAGTDDENVVTRVVAIAKDASMTSQDKQQSIWALLDPPSGQSAAAMGPRAPGAPVAIPLFEMQQRWLWLRLTVVTPPGTAISRLGELRVLYPDISLTAYLPAIFRGDKSDPGGFLRRLVGVLETTTQGIDDRIRSIARDIDPSTAPDE
jgi:hypothetical protein